MKKQKQLPGRWLFTIKLPELESYFLTYFKYLIKSDLFKENPEYNTLYDYAESALMNQLSKFIAFEEIEDFLCAAFHVFIEDKGGRQPILDFEDTKKIVDEGRKISLKISSNSNYKHLGSFGCLNNLGND